MDRLYIIENDVPAGPFTPSQLRERSITPDTRVWDEKSSAWVRAGDMEGFELFFAEKPEAEDADNPAEFIPEPQIETPRHDAEERRLRKKKLLFLYLLTAAACLTLTFIGLLVLGYTIKSTTLQTPY